MKQLVPLLFLITVISCTTKTSTKEVVSQQNLHEQTFANRSFIKEQEWDSLNKISNQIVTHKKRKLNKNYRTFGWHLYSNGSAYKNYNFSLLWGISYFTYNIIPETGKPKSIHQWKTTALIDSAQANNCKVFLSVSNFGNANNSTFLSNSKAQETLASNLTELLAYRNANGINIDFEGVAKKDKTKFTQFVVRLSKKLKKANPNYMVSLCLYGVDWNNILDIKALNAHINFYTLMGYDYYGGFSKVAGPVSPLKESKTFGKGLEASTKHYLNKGVKAKDLIIGLPYYGAEWDTYSNKIPSKVKRFRSHPPYKNIKRIYIDSLKSKVLFNPESSSSYLAIKNSDNSYREIWFENKKSLAIKYDWIKTNNLGGVGIWTLGYDDGYPELWNLLSEKFSE
ncbi:glycosyl hydrolase family 18 protein [uncultured Tenacibaculum sp.]|uniref:glycosyl hydrolase family 18 protein n=1 Tax=uncultured Tenacibaculum sp. TaxID=174713 RepID=UPI0026246662|nr:glycosyl hydrolase family 18 protein [uncultured Tenacibaculum sp.]